MAVNMFDQFDDESVDVVSPLNMFDQFDDDSIDEPIEAAAAPVMAGQSYDSATTEKANEEFLDKTSSAGNFANSVKQGWLGLKSTIEYLKRAPLIEKGTQAKSGDHIIGYDPGGNPILSSQAYTAEQQERVNKAVSSIGDKASEEYALSVAPLQAEMANIPKRPATEAMLKAKGVGDMFDAFTVDPLGIMADIGVSSMVQQLPALALTVATRKPSVAALAAGGNSYANELSGGVMDYLAKSGVDTRDPQQIITALKDQKTADDALAYASRGALPVAALDMLSGGLAGKTFIPDAVMKTGMAKDVASTFVTQPLVQGAMGAAGETGKQLAQEGEISAPGEIFAEAIGEFSSAPVEAGSMAYERIAERNRFDQHNTPAGVLYTPTHTLSTGAEVQQATKAGKIVSGVYVDKAGKVFKDANATRKPVDPNSVYGPLNAEAQAEAIKAEVMGRGVTKPAEVNQGIINSLYGATPLRDPAQAFAGAPLPTDLATTRANQAQIDATPLETAGLAQDLRRTPAVPGKAPQATMPVTPDEQVSMLEAEAKKAGLTDPVAVNQYVIDQLYGRRSQAEINQAEINRTPLDVPRETPKGIIASAKQPEAPTLPTEQPSRTDALIEERNYLSGLLSHDAPPSAVRDAMQVRVHNIDIELKGREPVTKPVPKGQFDPNRDDVLELMRIEGGLDTDLESDWQGRFSHLNAKGKKNIEQPGKGKSLDALAEKAYELGFIESHDRKEFEKLLDVAQSGKPVYSRYASGKDSKQARDSLKAEMERLKVDKEAKERKADEDSMAAFAEEYSKLLDGNRFDKVVGPKGEAVAKVPPNMGRREDGRTETRRKNQSAREYYQSLSNDELMDIVLKHDLTGIKGRRAFVIEQEQAAHFVSVDADSLKWVNDNMSPDNGDKLLQTVGTALVAEFGYDNVYHISGDEFYVLGFDGQDSELLKQGMANVEKALSQQVITAEKPDGTRIELKGIAATPGYGTNKKEADNELKSTKQTREDAGQRAPRGEAPASAVITAAEGQQDTQRDRAGNDAEAGSAGSQAPAVQAEVINAAAHEAATSPKNDLPQPTEAQKEAGNYKKGKVTIQGMDISIENPVGSKRRPHWPTLKHHYGYIRGSIGADTVPDASRHEIEHVDVFVNTVSISDNNPVFVVDQVDPKTGAFDEHKVMLGFESIEAAKAAYQSNYTKDWKGLGRITAAPVDEFKAWLDSGDTMAPFNKGLKAPEKTAAKAFTATHETSDGTPVMAVLDDAGKPIKNQWLDKDGNEIEDRYAAAIEIAPTKTPKEQALYDKAKGKKVAPAEQTDKFKAWVKSNEPVDSFIRLPNRDLKYTGTANEFTDMALKDFGFLIEQPGMQVTLQQMADKINAFSLDAKAGYVANQLRKIAGVEPVKQEASEATDIKSLLADTQAKLAEQEASGAVDDRLLEKERKLRASVKDDFESKTDGSLNKVEKSLRAVAYKDEKPGDVMLGNMKFVPFDVAVAAARESIANGIKPWPFQIHYNLDIAMRDAQRVLDAATKQEEKPAPAYGQSNKLFTEDAAAKARELLRKKLGQLNAGIDPEVMQAGIVLAGYHVEAGARKFTEFAQAMVKDLGDGIKPYLKSLYVAIHGWPGMDNAGMTATEQLTAEYVDMALNVVDMQAKSGAIIETTTPENTQDERAVPGNKGKKTLGGMAAGENGAPQATGDLFSGMPEGGDTGAQSDSGVDGGRVSTTRGGRSGVKGTHPAGSRGKRGTGRTGQGTGTDGTGLPVANETDDASGGIDRPNITAANFEITDDVRLGKGGEAEKFRDNLAAIRIIKTLEVENRRATVDEQKALARYVGWGGLANAFADSDGKFKQGWDARGQELRDLLSKEELAAARASTRNAHYTSETIVRGMWDGVRRLGFRGGLVLEPSAGTGNFVGMAPADAQGKFVAIEYDNITARIARALYPQATVLHSGFQRVPLQDNAFDLAIGNPPFGNESLNFQFKPELNGKSIHNQFFLGSMDALKKEGIMAMVVSRYLMDAKDSSARIELAKRGRLLGAIRLPDTAFKENARTEVVTDILFFQKDPFDANPSYDEKGNEIKAKFVPPSWVNVAEVADPLGGDKITVNSYFAEHPNMIIGTLERSDSMRYENDITVRLDKGADIAALLAKAIERLPQDVMRQHDTAIAAAIERHKSMSDALEIALSGGENGGIVSGPDGLFHITERETPEGDYELSKRKLTAESPWSPALFLDASGKWYREVQKIGADGKKVKAGRLNVYEREVFADESKIPDSLRLGKAKYEKLTKIVALRDLLKKQLVLETADAATKEIDANRIKLASSYKRFVELYGPVNANRNASLVADMPDGALVLALEMEYRKEQKEWTGKTVNNKKVYKTIKDEFAKPAPILKERVARPYAPPEHAASAVDALAITMSESGRIDVARIAHLLGKTEAQIIDELHDSMDEPLIFKDPEAGIWVKRDEYLTGQVKRKLNAAMAAGLQKNIDSLQKIQPPRIGAEYITPNIGMSWIHENVYTQFLEHLTGGKARVRHSSLTNAYGVSGDSKTTKAKEWSAERYSVVDLVSDLLNSRQSKVYDVDSDGKRHFNKEQTDLANLKREQIATEFMDWAFLDTARREMMVDAFNEKFNTRVSRQYDGSHMIFPGKVPDAVIKFRRHQTNAIWRGISSRFNLYDHAVGAGKTFTGIARAMERRRMGLSNKPAFVVPNHMVEQFAADVYRLYPAAKVLAAGKKDFERKGRRKLFAKIATGDWDIVILPHSSFAFIQVAPETELRYLTEELAAAEQAIKDAEEQAKEDGNDTGWRKPFNVKEAERVKSTIEQRIEKLSNRPKDRLLTFEQMGIDDLTVDEAHEFKNLFYNSRLSGVRGMGDKSGSQKAFDLYSKVRVLRDSPTGSVTFMTGTPLSNSAVEMYTMMRYLAADELKDLGLDHFDAWRAQYVGVSTKYEPTESGGLKEVNRLGRFWSNMRSMMDLYYSFTDAVTNDDIKKAFAEDNPGKEFPLPKVKGGGRQAVVVKPTPAQESILKDVLSGFDSLDSINDPRDRNIARLKLMDRARKVSLDARSADKRSTSTEEGGKLDTVSDEVYKIYRKWTLDRGTQLIFLDRGVKAAKGDDKVIKAYDALLDERRQAEASGDEEGYRKAVEKLDKYDPNEIEELRAAQGGGWNAYDQIKKNLIARGIPEHQIRFIQEANTDEQKQALFDAVKDGEVRVLIGSTPKMGAGTNVQNRLVALHHVDVTWKPSDIEQREGRIIRQGNLFNTPPETGRPNPLYRDDFEVEIKTYVTERTVDAKMWDLNSTKLKMINAIRTYDGSFNMEFDDNDSVNMAEIAAIATGDPLMMERIVLMGDLNKLELLERAHIRKMYGIKDSIAKAQSDAESLPELIERKKAHAAEAKQAVQSVMAEVQSRRVNVDGVEYDDDFKANEAVVAAIKKQQAGNDKARYSVKVNGEGLTNKGDIEKAIAKAIGDHAFAATIQGQRYTQELEAARPITEQATKMISGLANGTSAPSVNVGDIAGLALELDASMNFGGYANYSLSLISKDGATLATAGFKPGDSNKLSAVATRNALGELTTDLMRSLSGNEVKRLQSRLEQAVAELPELLMKADQKFDKSAEIVDKRKRLEEVTKELAGKAEVAKKPPISYSRYSKRTGKARGITRAQVEEAVTEFEKELANPEKIDIIAAETKASIMDAESLRMYGADQIRGYYVDRPQARGGGAIVLVLEDLDSVDDAIQTLRHEWIAHHGLNTFKPVDKKKIINRLLASRGERALKDAWAHVDRNYADETQDKQAEELLAYLTERPQSRFSKLWNDLVLLVEQALKAIGWISKNRTTKAEINQFIVDLTARVSQGAKQQSFAGEATAFSKYKLRDQEPGLKIDVDEDFMPAILKERAGGLPEPGSPDAMEMERSMPPVDLMIRYSKRKILAEVEKHSKGSGAIVKQWMRRNFTKEGLTNEPTFESGLVMDAEKNVGEHELAFMVSQFEKDLSDAYSKPYNKIAATDLADVNDYLSGNKAANIPQGLAPKLDHLRAYLDRLSGGMLAAMADMLRIEAAQLSEGQAAAFGLYLSGAEGGYLPAGVAKHFNLYQKINDNKGTYLTRSYQAHDDKAWKAKALNNADLMARARDYFRQEYPDLSPAEIDGEIKSILQRAQDNGNFVAHMTAGAKQGSKDTSLLMKKKDIPPIIRELLGEYKDPKLNFVRSATKMQWYVANHHFMMNVRNTGLGTFLFERPTGEYHVQVAAEGSEAMNPLSGLYTSEEFRQGMIDASGVETATEIGRLVMRANSAIKYGKTILAPTTQVRNFLSAGLFTVMNGHFDWRHTQKAWKGMKSDLFTHDQAMNNYLRELIGLGVLHSNPFSGELKAAIEDFSKLDIYRKGPFQKGRQLLDFVQRSYQAGDDFWKIVGYENELALQIKAGVPLAEAKKAAAYRIRNGYPTYSMIPRGIKKLRRWWLIGTFVSFPYEIIRTSHNNVQFMAQDIKAGRKQAAAQRFAGMATVAGLSYGLSIASMIALGMDDDDDEKFRKLLPPWSRNSMLIYTGFDKNGAPTYYDMSYLDPYTYIKKPVSALMNGNNKTVMDKLGDASWEFAEPFMGIDIGAGVVRELVSNKKDSGGPVYNEEDAGWEKTKDILNHTRKALQPGVASNVERIIDAVNEETSRGGKKYVVSEELLALVGQRFGTLNIPQSIVYKSLEFGDRKSKASMILSYVAGSGEHISESEMASATEQMLEARTEVYEDMIDYINAAKAVGMNEDDLAELLESSGISSDDIDYMLEGEVPEWEMPSEFGEKGLTRAMLTAYDDERRQELEAEHDRRMEIIEEIMDKQ